MGSQQVDDVEDARSALVLISAGGGNGERLAHVLLMDAPQTGGGADAVIALDDDGDLVLKVHDSGIHDGKPECASQLQTEMFVLGMTIELASRRLENVSGRHASSKI